MILGAPTADQRLEHIAVACGHLMAWSEGLTAFDLDADVKLYHAMCRLIILIGEAANYLPISTKAQLGTVPWRKIIATRNVFVHQYWQLDRSLMINTIHNNVPLLMSAVAVWRSAKANP